jgi:hypothetical protein
LTLLNWSLAIRSPAAAAFWSQISASSRLPPSPRKQASGLAVGLDSFAGGGADSARVPSWPGKVRAVAAQAAVIVEFPEAAGAAFGECHFAQDGKCGPRGHVCVIGHGIGGILIPS